MRRLSRGIPDDQLTVNGTLKAIYERDITGDFAVGPEAFEAILQGYACANCLEYRAFKGACLPRCPTCGAGTGAEHTIPPWWQDQ